MPMNTLARTRCYDRPLNIYEAHLGSWKMNGEAWLSYEEIAEPLIAYLLEEIRSGTPAVSVHADPPRAQLHGQ